MDSLGRGLDSLIPDKSESSEISSSASSPKPAEVSPREDVLRSDRDSVFWIEIDKIEPNPYQPRREFNEEALQDLSVRRREYALLVAVPIELRHALEEVPQEEQPVRVVICVRHEQLV